MEYVKRHSGKFWQVCMVVMVCALVFAVSVFADNVKHEKGYTYNLEELSKKAEKNIKKVNKKLEERKEEERNKERELEAREHFEKGNALYDRNKFQEAKKEWQKALSITKDPKMQKYIKKSKKKAKKEMRTRKEEEKKERKRSAKKKKEKKHQLKKEIRRLEKGAKSLYSDKKYNEATVEFKEVLNLDPKNKTALRYLKLIPEKIRKTKERRK